MKIQVAGIIRESIVDGPGLRYVVFCQGCHQRCEGCHNEKTQPLDGGEWKDTADIFAEMQKDPLLAGLTLSGGEPFLQTEALCELAERARGRGLSVWAYSGYTWEELLDGADPAWRALLDRIDVLVDGPYEKDKATYGLRFRGSANQRLIDVPKSLERGDVVLWGR